MIKHRDYLKLLPEHYQEDGYASLSHQLLRQYFFVMGALGEDDDKFIENIAVLLPLEELQEEWGYFNNDVSIRSEPTAQNDVMDLRIISFPSELFYRRHEDDVLEVFGDEAPDWPTCFAALAFAYTTLGEVYEGRAAAEDDAEKRRLMVRACASMHALANEALLYMDQLVDPVESIQQQIKKEVSDRAARAANKKHEPVGIIKSRFVAFYSAGDFKTKASAIRAFRKTLSEAELKLFSVSNIDRTLADALRASRPKDEHE